MNPTNIVEVSNSFYYCAGVSITITAILFVFALLQVVYYWDEGYKKPFWKNISMISVCLAISLSLSILFTSLQRGERERLYTTHPYYFKCYLGEKKVLEAVTHEEPQFENGALRIVDQDGTITLFSNYILKINK